MNEYIHKLCNNALFRNLKKINYQESILKLSKKIISFSKIQNFM